MAEGCLLYYITDRTAFGEDELTRRRRLLEKIAEAARAGVDYIQLREKDLAIRELESLAREAVQIIRKNQPPGTAERAGKAALLINSRTDVAMAAGADGVHLRSDDVSPEVVRQVWSRGTGIHFRELSPRTPVIGVSCHSPAEVAQAEANGATFAAFAPIFEKKNAQLAGLDRLREACRTRIPVLALGGIALGNARSCLAVGAAGLAAIRLFQENDIAQVVLTLRHSFADR